VRKAYPEVPPKVQYSPGMGSGAVSGAGRDFEVGESPAEDVKVAVLRGHLASFDQASQHNSIRQVK